jgi:hypothetical protein
MKNFLFLPPKKRKHQKILGKKSQSLSPRLFGSQTKEQNRDGKGGFQEVRKARTYPLKGCLHNGHSIKLPAHSGHTQRCAQGRIKIDTFFSMHTVHKFVSVVVESFTKLSSMSSSHLER